MTSCVTTCTPHSTQPPCTLKMVCLFFRYVLKIWSFFQSLCPSSENIFSKIAYLSVHFLTSSAFIIFLQQYYLFHWSLYFFSVKGKVLGPSAFLCSLLLVYTFLPIFGWMARPFVPLLRINNLFRINTQRVNIANNNAEKQKLWSRLKYDLLLQPYELP